jgi:phosphatidylglycerophosphatase C
MSRRSSGGKMGFRGSQPVMADPLAADAIVAFDFDGTLTTHDSFTTFLKWRAGPVRYAVGLARLAPAIAAYGVHRNRGKLKAAAAREFLRGATRQQLDDDARRFAERHAPILFRPDAIATWRRWRAKGAKTVIVTASPDFLVAPFARGLGADTLIASALAFDDSDRATGALLGPNCRGKEKVKRLQDAFGPDVRLTAAYGDTSGDRDMLKIADEKGYRVFRAKPA